MRFYLSKNNILNIKTLEELKECEKSNDKNILKDLLKYYKLIDDYDGISRIITRKDLDKDSNIDFINYYRCIYYDYKNNKFMFDKYMYILSDLYKLKFKISKVNEVFKLSEIFEEDILPNLSLYLKSDKYLVYELYSCYYIVTKKEIELVEKKLKKDIEKIIKKDEINIHEFFFIDFLLTIYVNLYHLSYSDFDIVKRMREKFSIIDDMVKKVEDAIIIYNETLGSKVNEIKEAICNTLRLLITLCDSSSDQDILVSRIEKYSDISHYTKFLEKVSKMESKDFSMNDFIEEIKKIIKSGEKENILSIIGLYSLKSLTEGEKNTFIKKLKSFKNLTDEQKLEINIGIETTKFWCGDKFNLEVLDGKYVLNPLLLNFIEFDNNIISYEQLLENINKMDLIDTISISNWKRIRLIMKGCNPNWLISIITKISNRSIYDYSFLKMINQIFVDIYNEDEKMILTDFSRLEMIASSIDIHKRFNYVVSLIYIKIYNLWDDNSKELVSNVLSNLDTRLDTYESRRGYINMIAQCMIIFNDYTLLEMVLDSSKQLLKDEDYYIIYSVLIHALKDVSMDVYIKSIKYLNKLLIKEEKILEEDYRLIGLVAGKTLSKEITYNLDFGKLVCDNEKDYVLIDDYIEELDHVYECCGIKTKEKRLDGYYDVNLIEVLLQRIFFAFMETFKAGKKIMLNKNASGEDIIKELEKAVGHDKRVKIKEQIENGELIDNLWLNYINVHDLFKIIKLGNSKMFSSSINRFFLINNFILHPTSLILLSRLGLLGKIVNDDNLFILGSTCKEIIKLKENGYLDYSDIINNTSVFYDDLLDDCSSFISEIIENGRKIEVTNANVLGIVSSNNMNSIDNDIFKQAVLENGKVNLITEDTFYLYNKPFSNFSYSAFSYIISLYLNKTIDSECFYNVILELEKMNYKLYVDFDIYKNLLNLPSDSYKDKILCILKKYQD